MDIVQHHLKNNVNGINIEKVKIRKKFSKIYNFHSLEYFQSV